jgi:hypothetical protein
MAAGRAADHALRFAAIDSRLPVPTWRLECAICGLVAHLVLPNSAGERLHYGPTWDFAAPVCAATVAGGAP